ncbi:MAG: sensor histidine kinase [Thermodesulfovibrionales bacterium]|nr:sensor histidine kinase [Thermodesulfovibrionales bacterium]
MKLKLLPPENEIGFLPFLWLIFLSIFIINLLNRDMKPGIIVLNIVGLAVFLILYFRGFWFEGRKVWHVPIGMTVLGVVLMPLNPGSFVFFVYAAAFIGQIGKPSLGYRGLFLIMAVAGIACWTFGLLADLWLPAVVFPLIMGVANIHIHDRWRLNKQLLKAQDEVEEMAKIAERERISRDLHDLLGHTLSVIILKSELAGKLIHKNLKQSEQEIKEVEEISRKALSEVREVVKGFRKGGLEAELKSIKLALKAADIKYSINSTPIRVSSQIENVLSYILRESVTNIIRHSKATQCDFFIHHSYSHVELRIGDNGIGYLSDKNGSGIEGMRTRIKLLGGKMKINSANGTTIELRIPIRNSTDPKVQHD